MKLSYSEYNLKKKSSVNAQDTTKVQNGVLLKFTQNEDWGVADLCPRTELGDVSWKIEIEQRGLLFSRAVELALEDMLARKNQQSLLKNQPVKNNYLITDFLRQDLNQEIYRGETLKIKGNSQIDALAEKLNGVTIPLKLRLDFNSVLDSQSFEHFLTLLSDESIKRIEYIEDPTLLSDQWKVWNQQVPLAYDFQRAPYNENWARHRIVKPTRERVPEGENTTLTSAMEHPVGLAHGLRLAQSLAKNISGFLTLDIFEDTPFHSYFDQRGSELNFSASALREVGIGMTSALQCLEWRDL